MPSTGTLHPLTALMCTSSSGQLEGLQPELQGPTRNSPPTEALGLVLSLNSRSLHLLYIQHLPAATQAAWKKISDLNAEQTEAGHRAREKQKIKTRRNGSMGSLEGEHQERMRKTGKEKREKQAPASLREEFCFPLCVWQLSSYLSCGFGICAQVAIQLPL